MKQLRFVKQFVLTLLIKGIKVPNKKEAEKKLVEWKIIFNAKKTIIFIYL